MKKTHYIGTFISADEGHEYTLEVECFGFIQAFILLTAAAIKSAKHYQLRVIVDEYHSERTVDDVSKIANLLS